MLTDAQRAELRAAAHRGGLRMDAKGPREWAELVDPHTLHMQSAARCVVGQSMGRGSSAWAGGSYSAYLRGLDRLGITHPEQVHYGFSLPLFGNERDLERDDEWNALADAWREEIRKRVTMADPVNGQKEKVLVA